MNPGPTPRPQERFKIQEGFKVQDRNIQGKCLNLLLKNYHATMTLLRLISKHPQIAYFLNC